MFSLPKHYRYRLHTSNPTERAVQHDLKRRSFKVRVFPNVASPERIVSAVFVDRRVADGKTCIK